MRLGSERLRVHSLICRSPQHGKQKHNHHRTIFSGPHCTAIRLLDMEIEVRELLDNNTNICDRVSRVWGRESADLRKCRKFAQLERSVRSQ